MVMILLSLVFCLNAHALEVTTSLGQSITTNRINCADNITCTKKANGSVSVAVETFQQNQVVASTTALTKAQCGSTVISAAAAVQPLPEASTVLGCRYTFICGTADDFDIDPADGTDVIGRIYSVTGANTTTVINPSAGDEIRCTDADASITLEACAADRWCPTTNGSGAWTDVN